MNKSDQHFWLLLLAALVLAEVPLLSIPFSWFMTFFHEISHGLAALLSGGSIDSIRLRLNGSGVCYTRGGSRFFILLAGYMGAVIWGSLIYCMARQIAPRYITAIIIVLGLLIAASTLCYARDLVSWLILIGLLLLLVAVVKLQHIRGTQLAVKFIGMYIILDAIRAPLSLLGLHHSNDAAGLAELTLIPSLVWIALWWLFALVAIYTVWKTGRSS